MVRALINVKDYGAIGDGAHDDTIAIRNAVGAIPSTGGAVGFPIGEYKVTDTITISTTGSHLVGTGKRSTMFYFNPSSAKPLFSFTAGASTLALCSARRFSIYGQGSFQKIGIQALDVSDLVIDDVEVKNWTGNTSIGLQAKGRDMLTLRNFYCFADRPISLEENPNAEGTTADHFHFRDIYLVPQMATESSIVIGPDLSCSNLTIDGYVAFCYGLHGLYQNDSSPGGYRNTGWRLGNIRREHSESSAGYSIYINHPLEILSCDHIRCAVDGNGIYLRQIDAVTLLNCFYDGDGISLNADSSSQNILLQNFLREGDSTMTMTGLEKTFDQPPIEIWQPS
jgi:hypothetical protein